MRRSISFVAMSAFTALAAMSAPADAAPVQHVLGRAAPTFVADSKHSIAGMPVVEVQGRAAPTSYKFARAEGKGTRVAQEFVSTRFGRA